MNYLEHDTLSFRIFFDFRSSSHNPVKLWIDNVQSSLNLNLLLQQDFVVIVTTKYIPVVDNSICRVSVSANLNLFGTEKWFFSGIGICCMFPIIFGTILALILTVLQSCDFSVKVTNGYAISFGLVIPCVKIVSLSDSVGLNFNLLTISSIT